MTQYDPGRLFEGTVLLAGYIPGAGLTMLRSDREALLWLTEADEATGGRRLRPGRRVMRFQVAHLEQLKAVLPPAPHLEEA